MTWVKICGITNYEDAMAASRAGADAIGFVFYEKSPRWIDTERAQVIAARLPDRIEKIGVFVHGVNSGIEKIAEFVGLAGVQIHTRSFIESIEEFSFPSHLKRYLALPAEWLLKNPGTDLRSLSQIGKIDAVFLDSISEQKLGGTGQTFEWEKAASAADLVSKTVPLVVAGGLTPKNVGSAMEILRPWGVDVSSGVEMKPGKKDPQKIQEFVQAVRANERITKSWLLQ